MSHPRLGGASHGKPARSGRDRRHRGRRRSPPRPARAAAESPPAPARRPGQGQPEHRALAALPPGLQPSAVQPRVLQRDGQAQTGAAGGAGPGRVGSPEPLEDPLFLARPQPHAVVSDRDGHRVAVHRGGDHHVLALAVLDRVGQDVAQDALHPAPVHLGEASGRRQPELDPAVPALGQLLRVIGRTPHQIAHVNEVGFQRGRSRVVPADLQEVDQQRLEPLQLALQQLDGPGAGGFQIPPGLEQQVRGHLDGRERRPELVRDIGHELPLDQGQFLELAELGLQAGRHLVERGGQGREVIHAENLHALLEVAGRDLPRRLGRVPDGQHHPAGDQRRDRGQQHDERQSHRDQDPLHQQEEGLLLGEREHIVQLVVGPERHADGQGGPGVPGPEA